MSDTPYHLRRAERDMPDRAEQLAVLRGQKFLTLAMARGDEPYLVSLNYAFDESANCFYLHCAPEGRKLDVLRHNPRVWGQVIEDGGYLTGRCTHAYRSVMFSGRIEFITDIEAKRRALTIMVDQMDPDPEPLKQRLLENRRVEKVAILCLHVESMTGKKGP